VRLRPQPSCTPATALRSHAVYVSHPEAVAALIEQATTAAK
jgi:hypothetical protein